MKVTPTTPVSGLPFTSVNTPLKFTMGGTATFAEAGAGCWAAMGRTQQATEVTHTDKR